MFNPFHRAKPTCPACGSLLFETGGHGVLRCAACHTDLHVPWAYARWTWILVCVVLALIGSLTFSNDHAGTWLLFLILGSIPLRMIAGSLIPPWLEVGKQRPRVLFFFWYLMYALGAPLVVLAIGWFQVLTGPRGELTESLVAFSLPLAWIYSGFLLDPSKSFLDVCGVILGNSFFYAVATFAAWRGVHSILKRNRVTAMNLESKPDPEDDGLE